MIALGAQATASSLTRSSALLLSVSCRYSEQAHPHQSTSGFDLQNCLNVDMRSKLCKQVREKGKKSCPVQTRHPEECTWAQKQPCLESQTAVSLISHCSTCWEGRGKKIYIYLEAEDKDAKRSFTAINYSQTTFHFHFPHAIHGCHKNLIEITSNVVLVIYFGFSSKKIFTFHDRAE